MKIFFVSHCLLNSAAVVRQGGQKTALKQRFLENTLRLGIQLIQLPCPEFALYGHLRWGHTKEQFLTPAFMRQCKKIASYAAQQAAEYQRFPEQFDILGFVGMDGSPTCGVSVTCSGFSGGEFLPDTSLPKAEKVQGRGVLSDILAEMLPIPLYSLEQAVELLESGRF